MLLQSFFLSVYPSYRHMEHWLHFRRTFNWETSFPREECCPSIGPHDWFSWNTLSWSHC